MLKRYVIGVLFAVSLSAFAEPGPSFDCAKATPRVEKLICQSPELAELDGAMGVLYASGRPASPVWSSRIEPNWLARLQANWLGQRNTCADAACLADSYKEQNARLERLQFLDWNNETAYVAVLDIAKDQARVLGDQEQWRKQLGKCGDEACLEGAFRQRDNDLAALLKTVVRAGMKSYVSKKLGIGFDYLENRSVNECDAANCVTLVGAGIRQDTPVILEIHVQDGSLEQVADEIWQRRGATWMAAGRLDESEVEAYGGPWKGLQARVECSFSDRNGVHAAGECNTYLRSDGKRAIIIRDSAVSGKDGASEATISSMHFLR